MLPHRFSAWGRDALFFQNRRDVGWRAPFQIKMVDAADDFCFLLHDFGSPILSLAKAEKMLVGQRNFAIRHSFAAAPFDVLRYGPALFLGDAGKNGQHQLALAIEGVDVFLFEKHLHIGGLEFPNRGQCVNSVPSKARDGFRDDEVNRSTQSIID